MKKKENTLPTPGFELRTSSIAVRNANHSAMLAYTRKSPPSYYL